MKQHNPPSVVEFIRETYNEEEYSPWLLLLDHVLKDCGLSPGTARYLAIMFGNTHQFWIDMHRKWEEYNGGCNKEEHF